LEGEGVRRDAVPTKVCKSLKVLADEYRAKNLRKSGDEKNGVLWKTKICFGGKHWSHKEILKKKYEGN